LSGTKRESKIHYIIREFNVKGEKNNVIKRERLRRGIKARGRGRPEEEAGTRVYLVDQGPGKKSQRPGNKDTS